MFKFGALLFVLFISYNPRTCRTQPISGEPVIIEVKNILNTIDATVKTANIDGVRTLAKIKKVTDNLRHNATVIEGKINAAVNEALMIGRIDALGVDSGKVVNDCVVRSPSVKSEAAKILTDANSCVSSAVESIERELNDTYSSIESILVRINSDQNLAETCVAEYGKTEKELGNAVVTALCVTQAKKRILTAIKDVLSTRNDAAFRNVLYIDAPNRLASCDDSSSISSFVANTDFTYVKIMTCISNS